MGKLIVWIAAAAFSLIALGVIVGTGRATRPALRSSHKPTRASIKVKRSAMKPKDQTIKAGDPSVVEERPNDRDCEEDRRYREGLEQECKRRYDAARDAFSDEMVQLAETEGAGAAFYRLKETALSAPGSLEEKSRTLAAIEIIRKASAEYPEFEAEAIATLSQLARDRGADSDARAAGLAMLLGFDMPAPVFRAFPYSLEDGEWVFTPRPSEAVMTLSFTRSDLIGPFHPLSRPLTSLRTRSQADPSFREYVRALGLNGEEDPALRRMAVMALPFVDPSPEALSDLHASEPRRDSSGAVTFGEVYLRREALLASREYYRCLKDGRSMELILQACERYAAYVWSDSPVVALFRRVAEEGPLELEEGLRRFATSLPLGPYRDQLLEALKRDE